MRMKWRTWSASKPHHDHDLLRMSDCGPASWERCHKAVQELVRLIPNFQRKIDDGLPEELSEFYAEVSYVMVVVEIGIFTSEFWMVSFSMVPMAPVVTTWVRFVLVLQIGWTRLTLALLLYWILIAARIGESCTMLQDNSYVLQNLIGTTLHESSEYYSVQPSDRIIRSIRAKLWAFDAESDWLSSYHSRCFYVKYKLNTAQLESGYLKSMLLIKVCHFCLVFWPVFHTKGFHRSIKAYSHLPLQQRIF